MLSAHEREIPMRLLCVPELPDRVIRFWSDTHHINTTTWFARTTLDEQCDAKGSNSDRRLILI